MEERSRCNGEAVISAKKPEIICSIPYTRIVSEEKQADDSCKIVTVNFEAVATIATTSAGRRKKQPFPQRSADLNDSNFRGIYFTMETKFVNQEPTVVVTSVLRVGLPLGRGPGRRRRRRRFPQDTLLGLDGSSSNCRRGPGRARRHALFHGRHHRASDSGISLLSDTDDEPTTKKNFPLDHTTDKKCISCGTTRTPLWRGAEQGTALCNACGIRYKKYRVRCMECWHVPRRDQTLVHACSACGAPFQ